MAMARARLHAAGIRRGCFYLSLMLATFGALAQPDAGKAQPNELNFGVVRQGAIVEGSVRVFEDGRDTARIPFNAQPPAFARIQRTNLGTQIYGEYGPRIIADVFISIDTNATGKHIGTLLVEIGAQSISVPISVNVLPRDPSATKLLVTETPLNRVSTEEASHFNDWLALVETAELNANYLSVTRGQSVFNNHDLAEFDAVLLGESGLCHSLESDIEELRAFVNAGGRLLIAANAFYGNSVDKANTMLEWVGLRMIDTEPERPNINDTAPFDITGDDIVEDPRTESVRYVKCFRPSPIAVTEESKGRILVKAPQFPEEGYVAMGRLGNGEIIVVGQSLWWDWISDRQFRGSDNARLLSNLIALPGDDG